MQSHRHTPDEPRAGRYLGDAVYGALDGTITTFAVVAAVAGAALSTSVILIMGFANLLGDGISMAVGNYLAKRSEMEYRRQEREREYEEVRKFPEDERREVREIYTKKGFSGAALDHAVKTVTANEDRWVDEMMVGELGIFQENISPIRAGITTFVAFFVVGIVPLLSYILSLQFDFFAQHSLVTACILTGVTIFLVGSVRSLLIAKKWWRAGLEMLLVGGVAAIVAFFVGYALKSVV